MTSVPLTGAVKRIRVAARVHVHPAGAHLGAVVARDGHLLFRDQPVARPLPAQRLRLQVDPLRLGAQPDRPRHRRVLPLGVEYGALGAAGGDRLAGGVVLDVAHVIQQGVAPPGKVLHLLGADLRHQAPAAHHAVGDLVQLRLGNRLQQLLRAGARFGVVEAAPGQQRRGGQQRARLPSGAPGSPCTPPPAGRHRHWEGRHGIR